MRSQKGLSMWAVVFSIMGIVILALLFMKLFPPYYDNVKIREGLNKLVADPDTTRLTRMQLVRRLDNILYIDFAHEIVDLGKALRMTKSQATMNINVDYEVVVPLVYNLSALIEFENSLEIPR